MITISKEYLQRVRGTMPEVADAKAERYQGRNTA